MMVGMQEGVVAGRAAIEFELADETCLDERVERVVDSCARRLNVVLVQGGPEFVYRSVVRVAKQIVKHGYALRRAPETGSGERFIDLV